MVFPLNVLRQHYLRRYAPRFRHAKKLFVFDLALLCSTLVFGGAAFVYFLYTPPETPRAEVVIQLPEGRIKSGAVATFQFTVSRPAEVQLETAEMMVSYPKGFSVVTVTLNGEAVASTSTSYMLNFATTGTVRAVVRGQYVSTVGQEDSISVRVRDHSTGLFLGAARASVFGRESVVVGAVVFPSRVVQDGQSSLMLTVRNESGEQAYDLSVPLSLPREISIKEVKPSRGSIEQGVWYVPQLLPQEKATVRLLVETSFGANQTELRGQFVPEVIVGKERFSQTVVPFVTKRSLASIAASVRSEKGDSVSPGSRVALTVTAKNNGKETVQNLFLDILFDETVVDALGLLRLYAGSVRIPGGVQLALDRTSFLPGEEEVRPLSIPIRQDTTNETVDLRFVARATLSEGEQQVFGAYQLAPLPIGTSLTAEGEVRYFTPEGDQLGRGPLPPTVGAVTKYWVIVTVKNGRGVAEKPSVRVFLPQRVTATGQSSVTRGESPVASVENHVVVWQGPTLQPFQTAEVAFEISYEPQLSEVGAIATLVDRIDVASYDPIIKQTLTHTINKGLTTALPRDVQGQAMGGVVTEGE